MADRGQANEVTFGRILERFDRADSDRSEILNRLDGINTRLDVLNGRTGKLEDDSLKARLVAEQVGKMAAPVQTLQSFINTAKNWGWKLAMFFALALIVGNQAATKILEFLIKWASAPTGN